MVESGFQKFYFFRRKIYNDSMVFIKWLVINYR